MTAFLLRFVLPLLLTMLAAFGLQNFGGEYSVYSFLVTDTGIALTFGGNMVDIVVRAFRKNRCNNGAHG